MMEKLMNRKNKKGFTLIELIVVIAIIAILAAIAVPRFAGFQATAKSKSALAEAKVIYTSLVALNAEEVAVTSATMSAGTPSLTKLTGPLDGTLVITTYDNFTYTTSAAKGSIVATCSNGAISVP